MKEGPNWIYFLWLVYFLLQMRTFKEDKFSANCSCMSSGLSGTGHGWGQTGINHRGVALLSGDHHNGSTIACGQPRLSLEGGGRGQRDLNGQWPAVTRSLLVCRIMVGDVGGCGNGFGNRGDHGHGLFHNEGKTHLLHFLLCRQILFWHAVAV